MEEGQNNYFMSEDSRGGTKYRVDPKSEIKSVVDTFAGIKRDYLGREINTGYAIMNEEGVARTAGFLEGSITKITHLSNYTNENRINRQLRHYLKTWVFVLVTNKKRWKVKDMRVIISEIEKLLHESMLRANQALEANLTAKSHQVNELLSHGDGKKKNIRSFFGGEE